MKSQANLTVLILRRPATTIATKPGHQQPLIKTKKSITWKQKLITESNTNNSGIGFSRSRSDGLFEILKK
jgi:hypothetical protein